MKPGTAVAIAAFGAMLAIGPAAPEALGQETEAPALRGDQISESVPESAGDPATAAAAEAEAEAAARAAMEAEVAAEAARQVLLAEARAAAITAASAPGATDDPLIKRVADYALFQRDLAAVSQRALDEPEDLDAVMDALAAYDARTLSDAWLAYAAFLAAQNPEFTDRVREVADYYGEAQLVQGMMNQPEYALSFPGARTAAREVLGVIEVDATRLEAIGGQLKQESYDLQSRGWSNLIARDRDDRLEALRAPSRINLPDQEMLASVAYGAPIGSAEPAGVSDRRRAAFWNAVNYRPAPTQADRAETLNEDAEALGVMMTLAALRVLNVSAQRPDLVAYLLDLPDTKDCLDFAKLHMQQCVAAAHFKYEDAFCIAEHQLYDYSRCLGESIDLALRD